MSDVTMEPIIAIFKAGTEFYKACKEFLLIKKVDELQHDVELIKGSFFSNALDFVEKASVCENTDNTRFFLESAYNNFSQSVKMYSDSMGKFMGTMNSYTLVDGFADSIKSEGSNAISRYYNRVVDGAKERITVSDKAKAKQQWKECEELEMSFIGKAMCEYYMKEISLCLSSIDSALGVNYMPLYKTMVANPLLDVSFSSNDLIFPVIAGLFWDCLPCQCEEYIQIMNELASKYCISLDDLPNRERLVMFLKKETHGCRNDVFNYKRMRFVELLQLPLDFRQP